MDEYRIFYDVVEEAVEIIAILQKSRAYEWLEEEGQEEEGGSMRGKVFRSLKLLRQELAEEETTHAM